MPEEITYPTEVKAHATARAIRKVVPVTQWYCPECHKSGDWVQIATNGTGPETECSRYYRFKSCPRCDYQMPSGWYDKPIIVMPEVG